MGFGDNEPPSLRIDPFPATLGSPNRLHIYWIAFLKWDYYELRWSAASGPETQVDIDSGQLDADFDLQPARPGVLYRIKVRGCSKSVAGRGLYCSPYSPVASVIAAPDFTSVRQFLRTSGVTADSLRSLGRRRRRLRLTSLAGCAGARSRACGAVVPGPGCQ